MGATLPPPSEMAAPRLVVDLLGLSVRIEAADPWVRSRLGELLGELRHDAPGSRVLRLLRQAGPAGGQRVLYDGERVVAAGMTETESLAMVLWYVNHLALGTRSYAVVHAGSVARHGRGMVLAAPMEAGKSTLVTALARAGWAYASDELAALSLSTGRLHPYRCPIALDAGSFPLFPDLAPPDLRDGAAQSWHLRPNDVSGHWCSEPVEVAAVVFPSYRGAASCHLETVGAGEALSLLASHTLNLASCGGPAFRALARLAGTVPAYRLVFDDLAEATEALESVVAR